MEGLVRLVLVSMLVFGCAYLALCAGRALVKVAAKRLGLTVRSTAWFSGGGAVWSLSGISAAGRLGRVQCDSLTAFVRQPASKHKWLTLHAKGLQADFPLGGPRGQGTALAHSSEGAQRSEGDAHPDRQPASPAACEGDVSPTGKARASLQFRRLARRAICRLIECAVYVVVSLVNLNLEDLELRLAPSAMFELDRLSVHLSYAPLPTAPDAPDAGARSKPAAGRRRPRPFLLEVELEALCLLALGREVDGNSGDDASQGMAGERDGIDHPRNRGEPALEVSGVLRLEITCGADFRTRRMDDLAFNMDVGPISVHTQNIFHVLFSLPQSATPAASSPAPASMGMNSPLAWQDSRPLSNFSTSENCIAKDGMGFSKDSQFFPRRIAAHLESITVHCISAIGTSHGGADTCGSAAVAAADIKLDVRFNPLDPEADPCMAGVPYALHTVNMNVARVVGDCYGRPVGSSWRSQVFEMGTVAIKLEGGRQITGTARAVMPSLRIELERIPTILRLCEETIHSLRLVRRSRRPTSGAFSVQQGNKLARRPPVRRRPRRLSAIPTKRSTPEGLLGRLSPAAVELLENVPPIAVTVDVVEPSVAVIARRAANSVAVTGKVDNVHLGLQYGDVLPIASPSVVPSLDADADSTLHADFQFSHGCQGPAPNNKSAARQSVWGQLLVIAGMGPSVIQGESGMAFFQNSGCHTLFGAQLLRQQVSVALPSPLDRKVPNAALWSGGDLFVHVKLNAVDMACDDEEGWATDFVEELVQTKTAVKLMREEVAESSCSISPSPPASGKAQTAALAALSILCEVEAVTVSVTGQGGPEDPRKRGVEVKAGRVCIARSASLEHRNSVEFGDVTSNGTGASWDVTLEDLTASSLVRAKGGYEHVTILAVALAHCGDAEGAASLRVPEVFVFLSAPDIYCGFVAAAILARLERAAGAGSTALDDVSERPGPAADIGGFLDTHAKSQHVCVEVSRFDASLQLPEGPEVFVEADDLQVRHDMCGGSSVTLGTFRLLGVTPGSAQRKSELLRVKDMSVTFDGANQEKRCYVSKSANLVEDDAGPEANKDAGNDGAVRPPTVMIIVQAAQSRVPHSYKLADVIDSLNNLVKLTKLLKQEMFVSDAPTTTEARKTAPALSISVQTASFRLDDDPFEIALSRAYAVGLEEQKARLAREQAFHQKVIAVSKEIRHGGTSYAAQPGKVHRGYDVESAWWSLMEFNSRNWVRRVTEYIAAQQQRQVSQHPDEDADDGMDIVAGVVDLDNSYAGRKIRKYSTFGITRCAAVNNTDAINLEGRKTPIRPVPLFRIAMTGLKVMMKHPGFGRPETAEMISKIDGGASSVAQSYDLLLPADIEVELAEATVQVRDHPFPLLKVPPLRRQSDTLTSECPGPDNPGSSFSAKGLVILAEPMPGAESLYPVRVSLEPNGEDSFGIVVERSLAPVKVFMDLTARAYSDVQASFGVASLPSLQDVSRAMDTITKPSRDPSPPVGYWDKMRMLVHGSLRLKFAGSGGLCLRLRGSRDPYFGKHRGTGSSGYEAIWQKNARIAFGGEEFVTICADRFLLGAPRLQEWVYEQKSLPSVTVPDVADSDGAGRKARSTPVAGRTFEKIILNLEGESRLSIGLRFESECAGARCDVNVCKPVIPHSQVVLRTPGHARTVLGGTKYDSYKGFRSAAIHATFKIDCPVSVAGVSPVSGSAASAYNIVHLTPHCLSHFEKWASLFAGNMALAIRRHGTLFPDSPRETNKLGRVLRSIRAQGAASPLFLTYAHVCDQSAPGGIDAGVKARVEQLVFDVLLVQRAENGISRWQVDEASTNLINLDIRAVTNDATACRMRKSRSWCEIASAHGSNTVDIDGVETGNETAEWEDADDFTEIGKTEEDEDPGRWGILLGSPTVEPFIFTPRLVYSMRPREPPSDSQVRYQYHRQIMEGRDTAAVQTELLRKRLKELDEDVQRRSAMLHRMEEKMEVTADEKLLKEICSQVKMHVDRMNLLHHKRRVLLQYMQSVASDEQVRKVVENKQATIEVELQDDPEPLVAVPLLSNKEADRFGHRYIVHDAVILWNERVRNIIYKFFDLQQQHFALKYYMSQTASAIIRSFSERFSNATHTDQRASFNEDESFDQGAAEELLSKLLNEEGNRFVAAGEAYPSADHDAEAIDQAPQGVDGGVSGPQLPDYVPPGFHARSDHLVQLINPQLNFQSTRNGQGCMIIAADRTQWKALAILDEHYRRHKNNELVKTRSVFIADNAQFFVAYRSDFADPPPGHWHRDYGARAGENWPVSLPVECRVDQGDGLGPFHRVVERTSFTLHHDKHNALRLIPKKSDSAGGGGGALPGAGTVGAEPDIGDGRSDVLTLQFPTFRISADSFQYATVFDVINDLLVYNDPTRKERAEHVRSISLAADMEDLRTAAASIVVLQERIRELREMQKQYRNNLPQLKRADNASQLLAQYDMVNKQLLEAEEHLYVMMEAFSTAQQVKADRDDVSLAVKTTIKLNQVSWKMLLDTRAAFAEWKLQNAVFVLLNNEDHSSMKWLEIDKLHLSNELPNAHFVNLIGPYISDSRRLAVVDFERQKMLRMYWEEMAPVGGIAVVTHFEINMFPLVFQLTYDVGKILIAYFFPDNRKKEQQQQFTAASVPEASEEAPEACTPSSAAYTREANSSVNRLSELVLEGDADNLDAHSAATSGGSSLASGAITMPERPTEFESPLYASRHRSFNLQGAVNKSVSDLSQMATRASQNKMFVYIKIPGVQHCVSYQGPKENNLVDLTGFVFSLPTFEYRNKTWTWLEFTMQLKKDITRTILAHAGSLVNQKLQQLRSRSGMSSTSSITATGVPLSPSTSVPSSPITAPGARHSDGLKLQRSASSEGLSGHIASDERVAFRARSKSNLSSSTAYSASEDDSMRDTFGTASTRSGRKALKRNMFRGLKTKIKEIFVENDEPTKAVSAPQGSTISETAADEVATKGKLLLGKLYESSAP